jgi:predicted DNA-binding transcriptional regulator AlpA
LGSDKSFHVVLTQTGDTMNILRPNQLAKKLGLSMPTLWRRVQQDPDFPVPIKLSTAVTGFIESDCETYLELKVAESRANPTKRATAATAAAISVKNRTNNRQRDACHQSSLTGGT